LGGWTKAETELRAEARCRDQIFPVFRELYSAAPRRAAAWRPRERGREGTTPRGGSHWPLGVSAHPMGRRIHPKDEKEPVTAKYNAKSQRRRPFNREEGVLPLSHPPRRARAEGAEGRETSTRGSLHRGQIAHPAASQRGDVERGRRDYSRDHFTLHLASLFSPFLWPTSRHTPSIHSLYRHFALTIPKEARRIR